MCGVSIPVHLHSSIELANIIISQHSTVNLHCHQSRNIVQVAQQSKMFPKWNFSYTNNK